MWAFRSSCFFHFSSPLSPITVVLKLEHEENGFWWTATSPHSSPILYQLTSSHTCFLLSSPVSTKSLHTCFHIGQCPGLNLLKWLSDNMEKLRPFEKDFLLLTLPKTKGPHHRAKGEVPVLVRWQSQEWGGSLGQRRRKVVWDEQPGLAGLNYSSRLWAIGAISHCLVLAVG